jgi:hypothetical protein
MGNSAKRDDALAVSLVKLANHFREELSVSVLMKLLITNMMLSLSEPEALDSE